MSFKIHFGCGNLPLCSRVIAVPSGPKSYTFTVILAVFAPPAKMASCINREGISVITGPKCNKRFHL